MVTPTPVTTPSPSTASLVSGTSAGRRILGVGLAATVLSAGAYAYTAANTVGDSYAGDGSAEISGYTVSDIQYTLADNPTELDSVSFILSAPAAVVKAKASADATDYVDCTGSGTAWSCELTGLSVAAADELTVIATS